MRDLAGVYTITCVPTGAQYVGSAVWFARRFRQHESDLRLGKHRSTYMQRAWKKYGESAFSFGILLVCTKDQAVYFEQRAIDRLQPVFNTARVAGSSLGVVRTKDQCDAQRALRSRINLSKPDHGAGHLLAVVQSAEFRRRQSERLRAAHARGDYNEAQKKRAYARSKKYLVHGGFHTIKNWQRFTVGQQSQYTVGLSEA